MYIQSGPVRGSGRNLTGARQAREGSRGLPWGRFPTGSATQLDLVEESHETSPTVALVYSQKGDRPGCLKTRVFPRMSGSGALLISLLTTPKSPDSSNDKVTLIRAFRVAVTVGFEPTVGGYPTQLFESCTFGRSDTSPLTSLRHAPGCRQSRPVRREHHSARHPAPRHSLNPWPTRRPSR